MSDPITAPPIARSGHQPMEAVHADERPWETLRWSGQWSKMLFHPRPERPTEPNAGLVRLEGEFRIGARTYGPGTMLFYPDPHVEEPLVAETGGLMLFVQYQGPSTSGRPIYDGRFNVAERRPAEERIDV
jgi:hypothetical protein